MMEIILAVVLALLVTIAVLVASGERAGADIWPMVLLLFVLIWAGGLWLAPVGPPVTGVYWLPFVLVALVIGLFWAVIPPRRPKNPTPLTEEERTTPMSVAGFGLLFWLLCVGLAIAAFVRYVRYI